MSISNSYRTIDDLWTTAVTTILDKGHAVDTRLNYKVKEILGCSVILSSTDQTFLLNKRRRLSPAYACAEILWYLSLTGKIEMIQAYAPQYHKFAENGIAFGAYGARWRDNARGEKNQIELLVEHLRQSPASRQALVTMWNANDLSHAIVKDHADLPCTVSLQFLIRFDKLHLIATMRSNDAWLGLPYDVFAFTCLQRLVADALNIEPGMYTHQVGSLHLYEKNWAAAREALESRYYPVEYRRLEHEWNLTKNYINDWKGDIGQALECEEYYRTHEGSNDLNVDLDHPYSGMLYDIVACCAQKWNWNLIITSPVLLKALKNVANKRKELR